LRTGRPELTLLAQRVPQQLRLAPCRPSDQPGRHAPPPDIEQACGCPGRKRRQALQLLVAGDGERTCQGLQAARRWCANGQRFVPAKAAPGPSDGFTQRL